MRLMAALALVCMAGTNAYAQAFGATAGMKLEEFSNVRNLPDPELFEVAPPAPNPLFKDYAAAIGPRIGLCSIKGNTVDLGSEAAQLNLYRQLEVTLQEAYGPASASTALWTAFYKSPGMPAMPGIYLDSIDTEIYPVVFLSKNTKNFRVHLDYAFRPAGDCLRDFDLNAVDPTGL
jgi:hypothetical protein